MMQQISSTVNCTAYSSTIKTHMVMCRAAKKRGVHKQSEYIDRNNKVAIFMHP